MIIVRNCAIFLLAAWLIMGCTMVDTGGSKKPPANGLISTPATYYSTTKAKYLGTKYKDNLDRLVERIARNPKTATLQFANNISSVGGIGFFTHSATKTPDERYLEVVLATPESFETKGEYSEKVHRLFARYGGELLGILSGDNEIYQDRELSGYGLNLTWRNTINEAAGNRVMLARAIVYLPKEKVRSFMRGETNQNELLADAVIFGEEEDGPLALVSYRPQVLTPDFRPAIREDNLASANEPKAAPAQAPSVSAMAPAAKGNPKSEIAKKESPVVNEIAAAVEHNRPEAKTEVVKATPAAPEKSSDADSRFTEPVKDSTEKPNAKEADVVTAASEKPIEHGAPSGSASWPEAAPQSSKAIIVDARVEKKPSTVVESKSEETANEKQPGKTTPELALAPKVEAQPEKVAPTKTKTPTVAAKKSEAETKPIIELPKLAPAPVVPQAEAAPRKSTPTVEPKPSETVVAKLPGNQPIISPKEQESKRGLGSAVKVESPAPSVEPAPPLVTPREAEKVSAIKPPEARNQEAPAVKSPLAPAAIEAKTPAPARIAKPDMQTVERKAPVERAFEKPESSVHGSEVTSVKTEEMPVEKKQSIPEKPIAPTSITKGPAKMPAIEESKPLPLPSVVKTEAPRGEIKSPQAPTAPTAPPEIVREKPAGEQLALLKKPSDSIVENKPLAHPAAKVLEGFIIQIAFADKAKAQHWAETMERRGYAVSVTEAGVEGALRVRLGNFAARDDAERQLRSLKQDGMSGIIINLPQGFKPEARSSVP
jgi:sporulation related protein